MADKKITEMELYTVIKENLPESTPNYAEAVALCEKKMAQIVAKNEKEAARRAEKRANKEPDELAKTVLAYIGAEPISAAEIVAAIGDEDVTVAKVAARLREPIASGEIIKEIVTVDKKRVTKYRLA